MPQTEELPTGTDRRIPNGLSQQKNRRATTRNTIVGEDRVPSLQGLPRARKMSKHLKFVPASSDTLQIDVDHSNPDFCLCGNDFGPVSYSQSRSKNWHATIKLDHSLEPMQRICLQFALGSDPARERQNAERVRAGSPYPIVFFEVEK